MNNGRMIIIHRPYPITSSLNMPSDIIVSIDVNAAYRAFPQIYVVPTRGREQVGGNPLVPRKGCSNLMFPDLRETPERAGAPNSRIVELLAGEVAAWILCNF